MLTALDVPARPVRPALALFALTFAGTSYALQQTLVVPALPTIRDDLHTTTPWVTWIVTGMILVSAIVTPIAGRLGDLYGKQFVIRVALSLFLVGSVIASLAPNIATLIGARCLQGFGAGVIPLSVAVLKDVYDRERLGGAVGTFYAATPIGATVAFIAAGVIVDRLSWRFLFAFAAVAVAISIPLVGLLVPPSPVAEARTIDYLGAGLLALVLAPLLLALTEGNAWGWASGRVLALVALAAGAGVAWVRTERRTSAPLVDLAMLRRRSVVLTNATGFLHGMMFVSWLVLMPYFLQADPGLGYGFGSTVTQTGLYLAPAMIAGLFSGVLAGRLAQRTSGKWPLSLGFGLSAVGMAALAVAHARPWEVVAGSLGVGVGVPLAIAAAAQITVESVRASETGAATGIFTVMRFVGIVLGAQVVAAILDRWVVPGTDAATEHAVEICFFAAVAVSVIGMTVALLIPARASAGS